MQLKIRETGGALVLSMIGKLDGSSVWQIKQALEDLSKTSKTHRLQVDFRGVRQWERFGVAILAKNLKGLAIHFREISLTGLSEALETVFRSAGLGANILAVG